MKLNKLVIITGISCAFVLMAGVTQAQVVGGKPKAGGSSAVTDNPSPSPGAAIEPASQTNQQKNGATLGAGDQNTYSTDQKSARATKAEDGEKTKVKKQKKHSRKTESSGNGDTEKSSSSTDTSPKTEASPH